VCFFYLCPEHRSYHGMSGLKQGFYGMKCHARCSVKKKTFQVKIPNTVEYC
jgi:hypothetical protein